MIIMQMADFKLPYSLNLGIMESDNERRIGLEILKKIRILQLPLKLEEITEGRGNCFPLAIIAQLHRPEVFRNLSESIQLLACQQDLNLLRQAIHRFMINSKNPKILEYKIRYEEVIERIYDRNWSEYWKTMSKNYE